MNGIGDHFIALPALRALAERCDGELTLVCSNSAASHSLDELHLKSTVRVLQERGGMFDWKSAVAAIDGCDLFVSVVPYTSSSLKSLAEALQPTVSVGFVSSERSFPFTHPLKVDRERHSALVWFDVVRALWPDAHFEHYTQAPVLAHSAQEIVKSIKGKLPGSTKCLAVHNETQQEKTWPSERLNELLSEFLRAHSEYVCFLVGTRDSGVSCDEIGNRIIKTFRRTTDDRETDPKYSHLPLAVAQCLVANCDLFLGVDSCFLHLADLFRVPMVALFGPTLAKNVGPMMAPYRALQGNGHMEGISVQDALASLEEMVKVA